MTRASVVLWPVVVLVVALQGFTLSLHAEDRASPKESVEDPASEPARVFRVILPARDIEASVRFYRELLATEGERVSPGRHYFACGGVVLAVVDPRADGDDRDAHPNSDHVYLAVSDLESSHRRAGALRALSPEMGSIETRPWGERSFYLNDPSGNPLCFVDDSTLFLGHEYRPSTPDGGLFQVILEVRDMSRQVAFYRDTLGLRVTYSKGATDFSDQTFVRFATPGASLALHTQTEPDRPVAPARLSFMTHDIVGRRKELLERKVDLGPIRQPAPGVLITDGRDPEGNVIHIETRVDASSVNNETETEVKEALDAWVRAYNAGEWDVFLAFYADDPRFHLHEKGRTLYTSKEEVARAIRGFYASVTGASFTTHQLRVLAASDRVALVTTEYEHRLAFRDGEPLILKGTMHLFMEGSSDGWQVLAGDTITRDEVRNRHECP